MALVDEVPNDILSDIFRRTVLEPAQFGQLGCYTPKLRLVSKRWRQVHDDLVKAVKLSRREAASTWQVAGGGSASNAVITVFASMERVHNVESLTLPRCARACALDLLVHPHLSRLTKLTALDMCVCADFTPDVSQRLVSLFGPSLRSLKVSLESPREALLQRNILIHRTNILHTVTQFTNLTSLRLSFDVGCLLDDEVIPLTTLRQLSSLQLLGSFNFSNSGLCALADLRQVQELELSGQWICPLEDYGPGGPMAPPQSEGNMAVLGQLTNLKRLSFGKWRTFSMAGWMFLTRLSSLEQLEFHNMRLGNDLVAFIADRLTQLRQLQLMVYGEHGGVGCISTRALARFGNLEAVQHLSVSGFSPKANISPLIGMVSLENLYVDELELSDPATMQAIGSLSNLKGLDVRLAHDEESFRNARLQNARVLAMTRLVGLTSLKLLGEFALSNDGFAALCSLSRLRELCLPPIQRVTRDGVQALRNLAELRVLKFRHCSVGDAAVDALHVSGKLRQLEVQHCDGLTTWGAQALGTMVSLLHLTLDDCSVPVGMLREVLRQAVERGLCLSFDVDHSAERYVWT